MGHLLLQSVQLRSMRVEMALPLTRLGPVGVRLVEKMVQVRLDRFQARVEMAMPHRAEMAGPLKQRAQAMRGDRIHSEEAEAAVSKRLRERVEQVEHLGEAEAEALSLRARAELEPMVR